MKQNFEIHHSMFDIFNRYGINNPTYTSTTLTNNDVITCIMTSNAPCVTGSPATSNAIYMLITGIEQTEFNNPIKIYPNPVSNELTIEINGNNDKLNFEILNSTGQVVFKGNMTKETIIQTTNFAPGTYLIKLDNGKTIEFKKIIKE